MDQNVLQRALILQISQEQFAAPCCALHFQNQKNKLDFWYNSHPIILSFIKLKIITYFITRSRTNKYHAHEKGKYTTKKIPQKPKTQQVIAKAFAEGRLSGRKGLFMKKDIKDDENQHHHHHQLSSRQCFTPRETSKNVVKTERSTPN